MWSLILSGFHALSSPTYLQGYRDFLNTKEIEFNYIYQTHLPNSQGRNFKTAQLLNLVEAVSPIGYSLKYPPNWQRFASSASNPNSDIFLTRSFANPTGDITVTVTTTVKDFLVIPGELPKNVIRFDRVAELYIGIISQSGYKVSDIRSLTLDKRRAVKFVSETPDKKGCITVLVEGKDKKMIVSTAIYPIDSSVISGELLDQVVSEIGAIQDSITIR